MRRPAYDETFFQWCLEQGADVLLSVKGNQKTLYRQIQSQFQGKHDIPYTATDHDQKREAITTHVLLHHDSANSSIRFTASDSSALEH